MNRDMQHLCGQAYLAGCSREYAADVVRAVLEGLMGPSKTKERIFTQAILDDAPPSSPFGEYINAIIGRTEPVEDEE